MRKRSVNRRHPAKGLIESPTRFDVSESRLAKLLGYANATGRFCGVDAPKFEPDADIAHSFSASVTIYCRLGGNNCSFVGVADLDEFDTGSPAWRKRPRHLLSRVALILALQYAFTELTSMPLPGEVAKVVKL